MPTLLVMILAVVLCGCSHLRDPIYNYKLEDPKDSRAIYNLPHILPTTELRDGAFEVANVEAWDRLAKENDLVGKRIDDAIRVYGQDYLISLYRGREHPVMIYRLAGTYSWGVCGLVVLEANLQIREVTLDGAGRAPHSSRIESLRQKYQGSIRVPQHGNSMESIGRMQKLIREWNPTGATVEELVYVVGTPTERGKDYVLYVFDMGSFGVKWRFEIKDGKVISWRKWTYS